MPSAGILIIGNEILSGKVADLNSTFLCRELRALGVDVGQINVIPDRVDTIANAVRELSQKFDYVFTTGGVGPTHDDVTMEGVALAFGVALEEHPAFQAYFEKLLAQTGGEYNESYRKMSMLPARSVLIDTNDLLFPLVSKENVFIFPGIPKLLYKKFEAVRERVRGVPILLRRVYLTQYESEIAHYLNELLEKFPELELGSYPRTENEAHKVLVTLESRDADYLTRALDSLLARLPSDFVLRTE